MTKADSSPDREDDPIAAVPPPGPGVGIVRARAPLRLGLAGGGTDIPSYYEHYGGQVLNATMDRHAHAVIRTREDSSVRFSATDLRKEVVMDVSGPVELNGRLDLHKAVYREMMDKYNGGRRIALDLATSCDAPIGSGLGASSTLVVAMIRAFAEILKLPLNDYAIANLAFKIERIDCGFPGGKQDQFSAAFGGFNFIEFHSGGRTLVHPLCIGNRIVRKLEASLVLFDAGVSRESSRIIASQSKGISSDDADVLNAMHALKRNVPLMKERLMQGDFAGIVDSLRYGWENKKRSSDMISNPHIEEIYESAIGAGALAGKVSGAGGGGFMVFFAPPHKRMDVIRALGRFDGRAVHCHFTGHGSRAWTVPGT